MFVGNYYLLLVHIAVNQLNHYAYKPINICSFIYRTLKNI